MALSRNAGLHEAKERFNQYRFQASSMWASLLPNIEGSVTSTYRKDAVANKTPGSVPYGGDPYNLYTLGVKGTQPLFVYGSISAVREAGYDRQINEVNVEIAERDLTRELVTAFYQMVVNQNKIAILEDQEKVTTEALSTAQTRLRLAGGRELDVLTVRTQLALLKPKIESAKIDLAASAAALANIMGDQDQKNIQLRNYMPALSLKAAEAHLNLKDFRLPELERITLQKDQLDEEKSVELGKHLPQLRLLGDYNFLNYTKADLLDPASNSWSVQLQLTVPLFSGLSSIYDRRALNSRVAQLEYQEVDVRNDLSLQQIRARKSLESAEANLASAQDAADLSERAMGAGRHDYRFGLVDFLQFLQVQQSHFEALTSLNQLKLDTIVAYMNYFAASGQPMNELVNLLVAEEKK